MKPPKKLYAKAYKNQQEETLVDASPRLFDVAEDDGTATTVGVYVLNDIITARKVVESEGEGIS